MQDPRHRNRTFDRSSIGTYLAGYADRLRDALVSVDAEAMDQARALIEDAAAAGRKIYTIGNGGSAAIADHLCCDWVKGTHAEGHPTIHAHSLTANVALYTAVANDFGFERVFAHQIAMLGAEGDVLVAISSSGNSPNIIEGVKAADALGMKTIGLSGFSGGALKDAVGVSLYVDAQNYGIVEDAHQSLMHVLAQFIAIGRDETKA